MDCIIKNKTIPSSTASYSCEGCLGVISKFLNMTLQGKEVAFPMSSPFTKFAKRPKKIPIGETVAITSNKNKVFIFF